MITIEEFANFLNELLEAVEKAGFNETDIQAIGIEEEGKFSWSEMKNKLTDLAYDPYSSGAINGHLVVCLLNKIWLERIANYDGGSTGWVIRKFPELPETTLELTAILHRWEPEDVSGSFVEETLKQEVLDKTQWFVTKRGRKIASLETDFDVPATYLFNKGADVVVVRSSHWQDSSAKTLHLKELREWNKESLLENVFSQLDDKEPGWHQFYEELYSPNAGSQLSLEKVVALLCEFL